MLTLLDSETTTQDKVGVFLFIYRRRENEDENGATLKSSQKPYSFREILTLLDIPVQRKLIFVTLLPL